MSVISNVYQRIFGPHTVEVCKMTNPCVICDSKNVIAEAYLDSDGEAEMLVIKCPTCGPIKNLYRGMRGNTLYQREPRFQRNYAEWLTGEFRKPKFKREI